MKNNVVAKVKTAFLKGSDLVTEALKEYNFQTENYNYPRYTFGDQNYTDNYFEIWSTGMDWNVVYFLLKSTCANSHSAKPILFFPSGNSYQIGEGDFIQILQAVCNAEEGKKHWALSDSIRPFIKPIKNEHFVMKKGNLNFYLVEYSHASQKPVRFYIEEKSYNIICPIIGTCKCGEELYNSDVKSISSSKKDNGIIISHAKCKCGEVKDIGREDVKPTQ